MQVDKINNFKNSNAVHFNARLTLNHTLSIIDSFNSINQRIYQNNLKKGILTDEFVQEYTQMINRLGKDSDKVEITVRPQSYGDDYIMDVKVLRNNEEYRKAQGLLLCPDIKEALPKFLEDEYKWLVAWFKDKNGTERI